MALVFVETPTTIYVDMCVLCISSVRGRTRKNTEVETSICKWWDLNSHHLYISEFHNVPAFDYRCGWLWGFSFMPWLGGKGCSSVCVCFWNLIFEGFTLSYSSDSTAPSLQAGLSWFEERRQSGRHSAICNNKQKAAKSSAFGLEEMPSRGKLESHQMSLMPGSLRKLVKKTEILTGDWLPVSTHQPSLPSAHPWV